MDPDSEALFTTTHPTWCCLQTEPVNSCLAIQLYAQHTNGSHSLWATALHSLPQCSTDLLFIQATLTGMFGSFFMLAARMLPLVPAALVVLSGLARPKGFRKIDATFVAHVLGSPGSITAYGTRSMPSLLQALNAEHLKHLMGQYYLVAGQGQHVVSLCL